MCPYKQQKVTQNGQVVPPGVSSRTWFWFLLHDVKCTHCRNLSLIRHLLTSCIMNYYWHLFNFLMLSGLCHLWPQTLQHPQLCPQFSDSTGLTAASISLLWRRHCCLQPYFCSSLHISYHLALLLILWNCLVCVSGRRWCACGCDGLRIPLQPDMLGERHILSLRKATKLHLWTDRGMKCHKQPLHRRNTSHRQHRQRHKDTALSKLRSLPPVEILNPIIQP